MLCYLPLYSYLITDTWDVTNLLNLAKSISKSSPSILNENLEIMYKEAEKSGLKIAEIRPKYLDLGDLCSFTCNKSLKHFATIIEFKISQHLDTVTLTVSILISLSNSMCSIKIL